MYLTIQICTFSSWVTEDNQTWEMNLGQWLVRIIHLTEYNVVMNKRKVLYVWLLCPTSKTEVHSNLAIWIVGVFSTVYKSQYMTTPWLLNFRSHAHMHVRARARAHTHTHTHTHTLLYAYFLHSNGVTYNVFKCMPLKLRIHEQREWV